MHNGSPRSAEDGYPMSIPSEHRLRKHAEFEMVYRFGRRHFSTMLTAFYLLRGECPDAGSGSLKAAGGAQELANEPRVGITVGRALGKATVRNRIKRRTRAAVSENLGKLTRPVDVVINPKKALLTTEFRELCSEVARAFETVEQKAVPASTEQSARKDERPRRTAKPERLAARKT